MPTTELSPWLRAGLWLFAAGLAGVSMACEMLLFAEHTQTRLDTAIAVITGAGLVGCQYGFAGLGAFLARRRSVLAAGAVWLLTLALLALSISGSAGFFESRYQQSDQRAVQSSTGYQLRLHAIEALDQQTDELTAAAQAARAQGNSWYAGQLLEQAQASGSERQARLAELDQVEPFATSSSGALAGASGAQRWLLWWTLAALIDLCPLLVFAVLAGTSGTPLAAPTTARTAPPKRPTQRPAANAISPNVATIKARIRALELGDGLGIRAAMRTFGTSNYPRTKQAFDELIAEGFLVRDGNAFHYARPHTAHPH